MTTKKYSARNLKYKESVKNSFLKQGIMKTIGAELKDVKEGICEITLKNNSHCSQQHGYIHGGVVATIADSAAGYAAYTLCDENTSVLTVEFKINYLSPADGEKLLAIGSVIKSGRNITFSNSEVYSIKGEKRTLCATLFATIMNIPNLAEKDMDQACKN